jgi:cytidylate kinase
MPDADIKLYLTASEDERAERRLCELIQKGEKAELAAVLENVRFRDGIDSSRKDSPLTIAEDALVLDSTGLSIDQVVKKVLEIVREKEAVTLPSREKRDLQ